MVNTDYIAFPICIAEDEAYWSTGKLGTEASYWHERNWVRWKNVGRINYFPIRSFRATPYAKSATKGVTEGSETRITWPAVFANRPMVVESVMGPQATTRAPDTGHRYSRRIPNGLRVLIIPGQMSKLMRSSQQRLTRYVAGILTVRALCHKITSLACYRLVSEPCGLLGSSLHDCATSQPSAKLRRISLTTKRRMSTFGWKAYHI